MGAVYCLLRDADCWATAWGLSATRQLFGAPGSKIDNRWGLSLLHFIPQERSMVCVLNGDSRPLPHTPPDEGCQEESAGDTLDPARGTCSRSDAGLPVSSDHGLEGHATPFTQHFWLFRLKRTFRLFE